MTYTPHTPADIEAMMAEVGVSSWKELFASIPENLLLNRPLQLPEALSEYDLINYFKSLADRNCVFSGGSFLGAGAYRHFIPSIVSHIRYIDLSFGKSRKVRNSIMISNLI